MEAIPFLIPVVVFAIVGIVVRVAVLKQCAQVEAQKGDGEKRPV